jgi:hypothetical protein
VIRVQFRLAEAEYEAATREARRQGISVAELIRRSLCAALPIDTSKPWMRFAGMVQSAERESSARVDEVVYGQRA